MAKKKGGKSPKMGRSGSPKSGKKKGKGFGALPAREHPAVALADFYAADPLELSFAQGDSLNIIDVPTASGWLMAHNIDGDRGLIPHAYVSIGPRPKDRALPEWALTAAVEGDTVKVQEWLNGNGHADATRDTPTAQGVNLLMAASEHGQHECVVMLLDNGAMVDAVDGNQTTALMRVALVRQRGYGPRDDLNRVSEVLLRAGARTDIVAADGRTAEALMNPVLVLSRSASAASNKLPQRARSHGYLNAHLHAHRLLM